MNEVFGYCNGVLKDIEFASDRVFADKVLGDGFAIYPDIHFQFVTAPFDCKINFISTKSHSIGFIDSNGNDFLIHIGVDTFMLNGEGFKILVNVGDSLKKGDRIAKVDWDLLICKNFDPTCFLLNIDNHLQDIIKHTDGIADCDIVIGRY